MCLCSPASAKGGFPSLVPASPTTWGSVHHRGVTGGLPGRGAGAAGPGARSGPWDWGGVRCGAPVPPDFVPFSGSVCESTIKVLFGTEALCAKVYKWMF